MTVVLELAYQLPSLYLLAGVLRPCVKELRNSSRTKRPMDEEVALFRAVRRRDGQRCRVCDRNAESFVLVSTCPEHHDKDSLVTLCRTCAGLTQHCSIRPCSIPEFLSQLWGLGIGITTS
jgi:hypothetical protein